VLSDRQIIEAARSGMIAPFEPQQVRKMDDGGDFGLLRNCISFGASSFGYDTRVGRDFRMVSNKGPAVIDPKRIDTSAYESLDVFRDERGEYIFLPPLSFALASSVEYFCIPDDVIVLCVGKSTYARCGTFVNVTPLEPGWTGNVTLEVFNAAPKPVKIYVDEGLCQFVFLRGERPITTYGDRNGKYQGQTGVTLPRV
jgi:dCTP deaminase